MGWHTSHPRIRTKQGAYPSVEGGSLRKPMTDPETTCVAILSFSTVGFSNPQPEIRPSMFVSMINKMEYPCFRIIRAGSRPKQNARSKEFSRGIEPSMENPGIVWAGHR